MSSQAELINCLDRHYQFIRNQLQKGLYPDAVESAELFATYLRVKVEELGEDTNEQRNTNM